MAAANTKRTYVWVKLKGLPNNIRWPVEFMGYEDDMVNVYSQSDDTTYTIKITDVELKDHDWEHIGLKYLEKRKHLKSLFEEDLSCFKECQSHHPFAKDQSPPIGNEDQSPPTGIEDQSHPTGTEDQSPPTGIEDQSHPTGTEDQSPTTGTEDQSPQTGTEDQFPTTGTEDQSHPTGTGDQSPPIGNEDQFPPTGTGDQSPPTGNEDQSPPTGTEDQSPPTGTGDQSPPIGNEDQSPPTGTEDQSPPTGTDHEDQSPPTGTEDKSPPIGTEDQLPTTGTEVQSPTIILTSGLNQSQQEDVKNVCRTFGWGFSHSFHPKITHLVIKTEPEECRMCDRSLKFLQAIAHHVFIVNLQWIRDSGSKGIRQSEKNYEVIGDTGTIEMHNGPYLSRTKSSLLLKGFNIHLIGQAEDLTKDDITKLIMACGGTVIGASDVCHDSVIVTCYSHEGEEMNVLSPGERNAVKKVYEEYSINAVCREWIIDSLTCFAVQPITEYIHVRFKKFDVNEYIMICSGETVKQFM
ncbi:Breast cancer type 1 susceptibility protein-like [Mizuhopecten yessoensis]|uniref:Breast cancer type 1 susceptibility protein-like n=1 Tax=Mizuhopecten yessoensis TaxID=6573 RepID=A0A210QEE7_MIZYE|nr:Breast cancer type 1 susceptibility protein-like [Mizuhopecten yessoensis]